MAILSCLRFKISVAIVLFPTPSIIYWLALCANNKNVKVLCKVYLLNSQQLKKKNLLRTFPDLMHNSEMVKQVESLCNGA